MPYKPKISPDEKIAAIEAYLRGELGKTEAIHKLGIHKSSWDAWIRMYKTQGAAGLFPEAGNRKYSVELKEQVVQEYLAGKNSLWELCEKYSISRHSMVQAWIKRYNGPKGFRNRILLNPVKVGRLGDVPRLPGCFRCLITHYATSNKKRAFQLKKSGTGFPAPTYRTIANPLA